MTKFFENGLKFALIRQYRRELSQKPLNKDLNSKNAKNGKLGKVGKFITRPQGLVMREEIHDDVTNVYFTNL